MTKRHIKELAQKSYINGQLDDESVLYVAEKLSRRDLKQYINQLKSIERKNTVVISSAAELTDKERKIFEEVYEGKSVQYQTNSHLLMGIEIQDNDIVYNRSLKNRLESLTNHIRQI